jgi:general secretion pathway protein K
MRPRGQPRRSSRRARGAAVIIAMLLAALAATVVMALAADQQRWLATVTGRRDQAQAQSLALAGVQWTRAILLDNPAQITSLDQPWAIPLPPTPLENGTIDGRIIDAQGLLNVNNLRVTGAPGDAARLALARLFAARGVPAATLAPLADYIGAPQAEGTPRDADAWYVRQATPYLPAAAPMLRTAELGAVQGFDDAILAKVLPDLAALPEGTPINVNTATPAVLAAALGTTESALAPLLAERVGRPFTSIADFRNRLPQGVALADERSFAIASQYFVVSVRARQGDTVAQARALLLRRAQGWPQVLWQTLE